MLFNNLAYFLTKASAQRKRPDALAFDGEIAVSHV
jgi:hypothetical protein